MQLAMAVNFNAHPYDVAIMRPGWGRDNAEGYFGNPVKLRVESVRARVECLKAYLVYFKHRIGVVGCFSLEWQRKGITFCDGEFIRRIAELAGKRLGCACKPALCHGDVIAAWLNAGLAGLSELERQLDELLRKV